MCIFHINSSFSFSAISEWFYYCIWLNKQTLQTHYTNKLWSLKSKHITIICLCDPNEWTQSFTKVEYWIHDQSAKCMSKSTWCWDVLRRFVWIFVIHWYYVEMHAFIFEMAVTRHWYWSMQKWPSGRTKSNICKFLLLLFLLSFKYFHIFVSWKPSCLIHTVVLHKLLNN